MTCPFAEAPLIRALTPLVVRISTTRGAAERFAVLWSFAIDVPSSVTVSALNVAPVPLPVVDAME
jgi:hypothetical protein